MAAIFLNKSNGVENFTKNLLTVWSKRLPNFRNSSKSTFPKTGPFQNFSRVKEVKYSSPHTFCLCAKELQRKLDSFLHDFVLTIAPALAHSVALIDKRSVKLMDSVL